MSKRPREEEESTTMVTDTEATQEDTRAPIPKKLRIIQRVGPEVRKGVENREFCGKNTHFPSLFFDNLESVVRL